MKEREFDIVTPDDEIFENLNDLGAFRIGGKSDREIEEDYREKGPQVLSNIF